MKKIACFFGVHEMKIIQQGEYERTADGIFLASGHYFILQCQCCGTVKRKVLCA